VPTAAVSATPSAGSVTDEDDCSITLIQCSLRSRPELRN
jgi:hypothetical protein